MASATATVDGQNKIFMGHPVQGIPPNANVVIGNPRMALQAEPPRPPVYLHQLFHQSTRRSRFYLLRRDQILLYRLSAASLLLLVSMACIFFTLLLILRPRLPQLQIASVTVSPLSTINTNVFATCNVSLIITNPNRKLTAFYDSFRVSLHYQRDKLLLWDVQVLPFAQPAKSDTFMHADLKINNANVGKDVVTALKEDLGHGRARFEVKIFALIRLESKGWRTRSQVMMFYCPDVMVGFSVSNGSGDLLDPFKECQVAL